jgi:hypothetical protein
LKDCKVILAAAYNFAVITRFKNSSRQNHKKFSLRRIRDEENTKKRLTDADDIEKILGWDGILINILTIKAIDGNLLLYALLFHENDHQGTSFVFLCKTTFTCAQL